LAQVVTNDPDGKTQTVNQYYRVKKGDTLGDIAQKNGVRVAQLQSWNGLKSSEIGIGDQLIVGQTVVPVPQETPEVEVSENVESDSIKTQGGNDIISSYLLRQIEKTRQNVEEAEQGAEEIEQSIEETEQSIEEVE
jgi:membrane-bound lytic murein transglycosylase D